MVALQADLHGVCTFSAMEMIFNILDLMHPLLSSIAQVVPIWDGLNGGMDRFPAYAELLTNIQSISTFKATYNALSLAMPLPITNLSTTSRLIHPLPRADVGFDLPALEPIEVGRLD